MIIDSHLTKAQALKDNPRFRCPTEIKRDLRVIEIAYWAFDRKVHQGQLVIHAELAQEIGVIFKKLFLFGFPIGKMIPVADPRYEWDDERSMADNNTSAFNYRTIEGMERLSWHAFGRAIDINPLLNPCFQHGCPIPFGSAYLPERIGTLTAHSLWVNLFLDAGYSWGGYWKEPKDCQHFQKPW